VEREKTVPAVAHLLPKTYVEMWSEMKTNDGDDEKKSLIHALVDEETRPIKAK
jgi:hypothetical protein